MELNADIAIVGAGVLGLAHAYSAARRGQKVIVFERNPRAMGASVRNFGMIWPIGQPHGEMHGIAMQSREIWAEVLQQARLPYFASGSLHVVYRDDEPLSPANFSSSRLRSDTIASGSTRPEYSSAAMRCGRTGCLAVYGVQASSLTVDPRLTIAALPEFLSKRFGVQFRFGAAVHSIELPRIETSAERWKANQAIVCSGDDFETLYAEHFSVAGLTRVKLQMLRTPTQLGGWQLGPALAAGLTFRFYPAFSICTTLPALRRRIASETPEYDRWHIHGLVSQTVKGELTLGDSHEYGAASMSSIKRNWTTSSCATLPAFSMLLTSASRNDGMVSTPSTRKDLTSGSARRRASGS
jgi:FAD dependent oxidoreductase TIGR03364